MKKGIFCRSEFNNVNLSYLEWIKFYIVIENCVSEKGLTTCLTIKIPWMPGQLKKHHNYISHRGGDERKK